LYDRFLEKQDCNREFKISGRSSMRVRLREPKSKPVSIGFVGDITPGFPVYKPIRKSQHLLELLGSCDLVVANLESPITTAPSIKDRGISICSGPWSVNELKELNVKLANLANNHIMDHGLPGLEETQRTLTKNGVSWVGAGRDIKHASRPFIFKFDAGQITFLAYSYKAIDTPTIVSENSPGANLLIMEEAKKKIGTLRKRGHIVCASYHGGYEFFRIPAPKYRTIMKELAEAGAHLVIGHHAHVFQGIEFFDNNIIAYGLGNFHMNPLHKVEHRGTDVGLLLIVRFDLLGPFAYSIHFVHNQRSLTKLSLVHGQKMTELLSLFNQISDALTDKTKYTYEWGLDCCRMALGMNDASTVLWLRRLARRVYRFIKYTLKALIRHKRRKINGLQTKTISSVDEIYFAAIMGFPKKLSDFRKLKKPYKAYHINPDR
jgi:poly-gamma-glutamate synthesis protein (capsule biosynthesis protein)